MGISICPSEVEILYHIFVDICPELNILHEQWKNKSLLSNMHPSLCSFSNFNMHPYFYQRHIYEYFVSNSVLFFFVSRHLKCYSFTECGEIRLEIIDEYKIYYKEKAIFDKVDENFMIKYKAHQEMLSVNSTKVTSKWHYTHWMIFERYEYGISTS